MGLNLDEAFAMLNKLKGTKKAETKAPIAEITEIEALKLQLAEAEKKAEIKSAVVQTEEAEIEKEPKSKCSVVITDNNGKIAPDKYQYVEIIIRAEQLEKMGYEAGEYKRSSLKDGFLKELKVPTTKIVKKAKVQTESAIDLKSLTPEKLALLKQIMGQ